MLASHDRKSASGKLKKGRIASRRGESEIRKGIRTRRRLNRIFHCMEPAVVQRPESAVALREMFRRAGAALMLAKCFACNAAGSMASRERASRVSIRRQDQDLGRGYEQSQGNWSPGIRFVVMAIRQSIADGDKVFDFLRGDHRYNTNWDRPISRFVSSLLSQRAA